MRTLKNPGYFSIFFLLMADDIKPPPYTETYPPQTNNYPSQPPPYQPPPYTETYPQTNNHPSQPPYQAPPPRGHVVTTVYVEEDNIAWFFIGFFLAFFLDIIGFLICCCIFPFANGGRGTRRGWQGAFFGLLLSLILYLLLIFLL